MERQKFVVPQEISFTKITSLKWCLSLPRALFYILADNVVLCLRVTIGVLARIHGCREFLILIRQNVSRIYFIHLLNIHGSSADTFYRQFRTLFSTKYRRMLKKGSNGRFILKGDVDVRKIINSMTKDLGLRQDPLIPLSNSFVTIFQKNTKPSTDWRGRRCHETTPITNFFLSGHYRRSRKQVQIYDSSNFSHHKPGREYLPT